MEIIMSERILVVDDESSVREVIAQLLSLEGYRVTAVDCIAAAHKKIQESRDTHPFHAAIVDIRLPDGNGLDLIAEIKQVSPQTEVILMTGFASVETAVKAIEYGAFAYVTKPIRPEELYHTMRRALEKRQLLAENQRLLTELKQSNLLLADLNKTLEKRVEERTRDLRRSEKETLKKAQQLAIINEIINAITSSLDLKNVLQIVARQIGKIIRFDRASIALVNGSRMINRVYFLKPPGQQPLGEGQTYPLGGTGIQWVVRNKKLLIRQDFSGDPRFLEDEYIINSGMKSGVVIPLIYRDQVIGTLNLGSRKKAAYHRADGKLLQEIAGQIAIALENASLYRRLKDYSDKLELKVAQRTEALRENLRELKAAQAKLIQSEKLAATSKLIAGVSHEIKNPLNSMSFSVANLEKIMEAAHDLPQARRISMESISILKSDIERLKNLVNRFMAFARPARPRLEETDVNELLKGVLTNLQGQLNRKKIQLRVSYGQDLPLLKLEKDELHRSFLNLLLNSLEAVQTGGKISIKTSREDGNLSIRFKDNGSGIPPEIHNKIFDIFFTTKPTGSGLGLSQVYRDLESQKGKISFTSLPGRGTEFQIKIPIPDRAQ